MGPCIAFHRPYTAQNYHSRCDRLDILAQDDDSDILAEDDSVQSVCKKNSLNIFEKFQLKLSTEHNNYEPRF